MRADDDVYIRGDVLRPFLHSINSTDRPLYIGQVLVMILGIYLLINYFTFVRYS